MHAQRVRPEEKAGNFLISYTLFESLNRNFFQLNQFGSCYSRTVSQSYDVRMRALACAFCHLPPVRAHAINKNTLHLSSSLQAITLPTVNHNVYIYIYIPPIALSFAHFDRCIEEEQYSSRPSGRMKMENKWWKSGKTEQYTQRDDIHSHSFTK